MKKYTNILSFFNCAQPGHIIISKCINSFNQGIVYQKSKKHLKIFVFKTEFGKSNFFHDMTISDYLKKKYDQQEFFII